METIKLYRGDAEKIKEFDFSKTNKRCLVGPGIYLTDALKIAQTYRTKGSNKRSVETLFEAEAKDRNEAYKMAFEQYLQSYISVNNLRHLQGKYTKQKGKDWGMNPVPLKHKAEYDRLWEQQHVLFREAIDNGAVTSTYGIGSKGRKLIRVQWDHDIVVGYISEFVFNADAFNKSMVRLDRQISDIQFWELMWEYKTGFGTPYDTKHNFIQCNSMESRSYLPTQGPAPSLNLGQTFRKAAGISLSGIKYTKSVYDRIRSAIEPYGYRGFEYSGGVLVGGYGRHRAFCVWDDDWVNEHKTKRFR